MSMSGIASMLAQTGANVGQRIGAPVAGVGQNIGGMLAGREDRKRQQETAQEVQQLLQQNANNPAQLNSLGQKYASEGKNDMAKLFFDAAKTATAARQTQTTALETAGQDIQREAQLKRAIQVARQKGDEDSLVALKARALDPVEFLKGKAKPDDIYKVVGNRIFNTQTGHYVEPSEAADLMSASDLSKVATSESVITYLQTGNAKDLVAKPPEGELTEQELKDQRRQVRSQILATDSVLDAVDDALGLTDEYWAATYDLGKFVPLTDSRSLENYVKEIQANLAFDKLQNMRDNSKTGGALGQVSNIELELLKSSLSALDPADANFAKQLQKVRRHYETFKAALLGQKPPGDRYIELDNELYYVTDENEYEHLGEL